MARITAVYLRVSVKPEHHTGQEAALRRWAREHPGETIRWYRDKYDITTRDRPGFSKLLADIKAGNIDRVVIWRLDRLGHSAKELAVLFEDWMSRRVDVISLKDGFDLKSWAGRLVVNVLASVAAYETEGRAERIFAGQATAREAGKKWGGSVKGRRLKVTPEQLAKMRLLARKGAGVTAIARATGLSRPTIYRLLSYEPTLVRLKRRPSQTV